MKQNIYDNPKFFEGYSTLRKNEAGLNSALEIPAMQTLLPHLNGKRVLDLGCGAGHLCQKALAEKAVKVVGVDLSKSMLELAIQNTATSPVVSFVQCAIEDFTSPPAEFDVIVSSLAVHYVQNWSGLCFNVYKWLAPSGTFIFSTEHPLCTAALKGWFKGQEGEKLHWPVDKYRDEGQRVSHWFVEGVLKYHRTMETILNTLIDSGLQIRRVLEPEPTPEAVSKRPELADERRRPPFLIVQANKN